MQRYFRAWILYHTMIRHTPYSVNTHSSTVKNVRYHDRETSTSYPMCETPLNPASAQKIPVGALTVLERARWLPDLSPLRSLASHYVSDTIYTLGPRIRSKKAETEQNRHPQGRQRGDVQQAPDPPQYHVRSNGTHGTSYGRFVPLSRPNTQCVVADSVPILPTDERASVPPFTPPLRQSWHRAPAGPVALPGQP